MRTRIVFLLGLLGLSFFLAPLAQQFFQVLLLEPIAYLWWGVKQVIRVIPETLYWYFFVSCLGILGLFFLIRDIFEHRLIKEKQVRQQGPIEFLSENIVRSAKSNYFKWVIANRLANITLQVVWQKSGKDEKPRDFTYADLKGSPDIKSYLETGLLGSFMDYQGKKKLFGKSRETPLNLDISQVIDWVESEMEQ